MQINWAYIQDNWDWAGHMVIALGIAAVLTVLFRPILPWRIAAIGGLAFAMGHYHGREKRDYEVSVQMPPPQLESFYFWQWNWDQTTDYWPTAVLCTVLIWVVARRRSKTPSDPAD